MILIWISLVDYITWLKKQDLDLKGFLCKRLKFREAVEGSLILIWTSLVDYGGWSKKQERLV
jgi:hypothetical protein